MRMNVFDLAFVVTDEKTVPYIKAKASESTIEKEDVMARIDQLEKVLEKQIGSSIFEQDSRFVYKIEVWCAVKDRKEVVRT